jgi:hypothetical protein
VKKVHKFPMKKESVDQLCHSQMIWSVKRGKEQVGSVNVEERHMAIKGLVEML